MSTPNTGSRALRAKRMAKEREELEQENDDYAAFFKDEDMFHFTAYIMAPEDSVYRHKLVKLEFEIPANYPLVPPVVKFIQHTGERIHPNLYVEGKVCLSILGTWPGEPWAFGMKCNSVLITIRSLLDNQPYCHEPHQHDSPAFNEYVRFATWRWLLLDYLEHEKNPAARAWLQRHIRRNGWEMLVELKRQARVAEEGYPAATVADAAAFAAGTGAAVARGTAGVARAAPAGENRLLYSPYKRHMPILPRYDPLIEELETLWLSTLQDEGLESGGSGKRKIDAVDEIKSTDFGGNAAGDQEQKKQQQQPERPNKMEASHKPKEQSQPPKKRTKQDHEVIDLM